MSITPLPTPPSRADAANFRTRADTFLDALPTFVNEVNVLAVQLNEGVPLADQSAIDAAASAVLAEASRVGAVAAKDSAEAAAAAVGSSAGLPSLVGNAGKALTVTAFETGVEWASAGVASGYIELTASTTWSKPTEATWVYVDIIAGGGSGGTNTSTVAQGAAGGECVSKLFRASDLPASISVVVGAGGAAKLGSSSVNGADGGSSSFNGLTAYGGRGGLNGSLNLSTNLRSVSNVSVATDSLTKVIIMPNGGYSQCSTVHGGAGGGVGSGTVANSYPGKSIHHGDGGDGYGTADDAATATAGGFPGGGGGGRGYTSSVSTRTSGAGGAGVVRIWYW